MIAEKEIQENAKKLYLFEREQEAYIVGALSMMQEQDNWISVNEKEKLPKVICKILAFDILRCITVISFNPKYSSMEYYTHWQPLPTEPKEREGK